jgi:hypothetical protein
MQLVPSPEEWRSAAANLASSRSKPWRAHHADDTSDAGPTAKPGAEGGQGRRLCPGALAEVEDGQRRAETWRRSTCRRALRRCGVQSNRLRRYLRSLDDNETVGVPHRVGLRPALASAAFDRHLLYADPPLPMAPIGHHSRASRPAIRILENPLEHGAVRPLNYDETPRLFHAATIGAPVGKLQRKARTLPLPAC